MLDSLIFWEILSFVVILSLGFALFSLVRRAVSNGIRSEMDDKSVGREGEPPAEEVLERRYAGGEISREEYLTIRDDITRKQNA